MATSYNEGIGEASKSELDDVDFRGPGIQRDRQFGGSTRSVTSTKSEINLNPDYVLPKLTMENLFSFRPGAVNSAVEDCKTKVLKKELDGSVEGSWLLTEIDHWDLEKEKLLILTTNSILIVHYDFILLKVLDSRRVSLKSINRVQLGNLTYPAFSMMPPRRHGGARIHWNVEGATFAQRWNPFCSDIGYVTLCHHLLAYKADQQADPVYDVGNFIDAVTAKVHASSPSLKIENGPVMVESYGSVVSMVYNQSHVGFNMSRGGVSF